MMSIIAAAVAGSVLTLWFCHLWKKDGYDPAEEDVADWADEGFCMDPWAREEDDDE